MRAGRCLWPLARYHLLWDGTVSQELGGNYFHERDRQATVRRSRRRRERLGYKDIVEAA